MRPYPRNHTAIDNPLAARILWPPMSLKLISAFGLVTIIALAWACSEHRRKFPWRTVVSGLILQFLIAVFVLKTDAGLAFFNGCQRAVDRFMGFADEGNRLVFGPLATADVLGKSFGPANAFILAITITGTIILVAAVSSLLYHFGILQLIVRAIAWVVRRIMGTSGSETLAAAANIFVGQTEAPLVIRPYLAGMTRSELICVMIGGFASIAGGVLAVYSGVLKIPAGHLITQSVMSAPAALLIAKVLLPETQPSETAGGSTATIDRESINAVDAVCIGCTDGMKLSINVVAMLIGFTAVVGVTNWLLAHVAAPFGWHTVRPLQEVLGYLNAPFAWLMGIPSKDCLSVGQILGERLVLNEFIGYISLSQQKPVLDERSYVLTTYALCGFANLASVAVQIGGISALVPSRRGDLAQLGLKAMFGGMLACYMTACIAGILL